MSCQGYANTLIICKWVHKKGQVPIHWTGRQKDALELLCLHPPPQHTSRHIALQGFGVTNCKWQRRWGISSVSGAFPSESDLLCSEFASKSGKANFHRKEWQAPKITWVLMSVSRKSYCARKARWQQGMLAWQSWWELSEPARQWTHLSPSPSLSFPGWSVSRWDPFKQPCWEICISPSRFQGLSCFHSLSFSQCLFPTTRLQHYPATAWPWAFQSPPGILETTDQGKS